MEFLPPQSASRSGLRPSPGEGWCCPSPSRVLVSQGGEAGEPTLVERRAGAQGQRQVWLLAAVVVRRARRPREKCEAARRRWRRREREVQPQAARKKSYQQQGQRDS